MKLNKKFVCTGTLLDRNTIITSRSCFIEKFDYEYEGAKFSVTVENNKYHYSRYTWLKAYGGVKKYTDLSNKKISIAKLDSYFDYKVYVDHYEKVCL